jgi:hypothetical protein
MVVPNQKVTLQEIKIMAFLLTTKKIEANLSEPA